MDTAFPSSSFLLIGTLFGADKITLDVVGRIKMYREAGKLSGYLALVVPDVLVCRYGDAELSSVSCVVHSGV
jgi:hypothetical protein